MTVRVTASDMGCTAPDRHDRGQNTAGEPRTALVPRREASRFHVEGDWRTSAPAEASEEWEIICKRPRRRLIINVFGLDCMAEFSEREPSRFRKHRVDAGHLAPDDCLSGAGNLRLDPAQLVRQVDVAKAMSMRLNPARKCALSVGATCVASCFATARARAPSDGTPSRHSTNERKS